MVEVILESFTVQEERGEKEAGFLWKPEKQQHESEVVTRPERRPLGCVDCVTMPRAW